MRVEAHQEQEKENYAYFISADPIEPLPEEKKEQEREEKEEKEEVETVVAVTGDTEEELAPEEARRIVQQILSMPRLSKQGFAGLEKLYHKYGSKEMLADICSQLIKDGRTDEKSFFWYKRGVQAELKITKLYEYFMRAVPKHDTDPFPKNLLLYFQMENTLNSRQKAILYANIIRFWQAGQRCVQSLPGADRGIHAG